MCQCTTPQTPVCPPTWVDHLDLPTALFYRLLKDYCWIMMFRSPSLPQQEPKQGGNAEAAPAMAAAPPAASSLVPEDASQAGLRAALQKQQMELEGRRARLGAQKLSDKSAVPDLTLNGIEEFLGRDKILQWMRESSAALKQFLAANQSPTRPPDVGGDVQAQPPPGDALAYRIWATMLRSQGAYQQRYHAQEMSAKARETLDKLPWEEAPQKGGAAFVYRGVRFLTDEGIRQTATTSRSTPPRVGIVASAHPWESRRASAGTGTSSVPTGRDSSSSTGAPQLGRLPSGRVTCRHPEGGPQMHREPWCGAWRQRLFAKPGSSGMRLPKEMEKAASERGRCKHGAPAPVSGIDQPSANWRLSRRGRARIWE